MQQLEAEPIIQTLTRKDKEEALLLFAEKARRRFSDYCFYIDPSYELPKHLAFLHAKLEAVEKGEIKRLMISMPPRSGKSMTISRKFPAWYLGRNPDKNIIISSYSESLVKEFSRDVRGTIKSPLYKIAFGIDVAEDAQMVQDWNIARHRGGLLAQPVGGSITGYGSDCFIIDDIFKSMQEADSETIRENIWLWYQSVVLTRLEPDASLIICLTRWGNDDLAGRIQKAEKGWEIINLPALAEENDPLGRELGEPLWERRFDREALAEIKKNSGSRVWFSLYQGKPMDESGRKFRREWFKWYENLPIEISSRGAGIDTATSVKTTNDNTSMVSVARGEDNFIYVEDVFCDKVTVSGFAEYAVNQQKCIKFNKIRLEKNNAGEAFRQRIIEIAREKGIGMPIDCEQTSTDKMVRAMEFQSLVENGTLKFKSGNSRIAALVEHLINFDGKGSDIDDDVDALGFAIKAVNLDDGFAVATSAHDVY